MQATISNLHWYSDFNGDEVGYPEVLVVGVYRSEALKCDFYINTEDGEVLEVIPDEEEPVNTIPFKAFQPKLRTDVKVSHEIVTTAKIRRGK